MIGLKECLLVMAGGGIGAVLRYLTTSLLNEKFSLKHWGTFWVNVTGCFVLGILTELLLKSGLYIHVFVIVGIVGSYTTFSAFEYENIDLIAHEKYFEFIKYSTFSCFFAFIAVGLGFYLAKYLQMIF